MVEFNICLQLESKGICIGRVQVQRMSVFAMGQRLSCLPATRIKDRLGLNRYEKVKRWMYRNGVE